ncbi:o-succinylbenzoate synthase [Cyclobacterium qasimii]|uniref:O-succinylbenzoate synthase n=2 Tax=Cyclobacterium qasimii TaxID=1350429 RepID=S7VCW5_9BACT|nr:o-succinylbenzoate synthase [Cyclobacterium qasimii]EPR67816.1 O-succinylbenzoate synthase [Cyclobacterium qasimii M12-11B]GEO20400.1 o-succinylbenzoate synthase [Cyclobacterium qasimii]
MTQLFKVKCSIKAYPLNFKFEAGTSRGVLKEKITYFIQVTSDQYPGIIGIGEAGPLKGLSKDDVPNFLEQAIKILNLVEEMEFHASQEVLLNQIDNMMLHEFPSVQFGLETALLDLINGGQRKILDNGFYASGSPLPINGLVWMGEKDFMERQIDQKIEQGYDCIKMKIGAIDFDQECELLEKIRSRFPKDKISIRVDANGAFAPQDALGKLERLAKFEIHSIEQPIQPGLIAEMRELCKQSPIPIALDEELIGIYGRENKLQLLESIRPQFLILKPTLLGGIIPTREWVALAQQTNTGWWMTSALESNIGLNAIAQLTSSLKAEMPQGLGTGQLYHNNIDSPLSILNGQIFYDTKLEWNLSEILND